MRANDPTHDLSTQLPIDGLLDEIDELRAELLRLRQRVERDRSGPVVPSPGRTTSRRSLLGLAGASAVGAVGATLAATSRPAAAADPNDVVKNTDNPVVAATTLTGDFETPILGLFNEAEGGNASALYMLTSSSGAPTLRADNDAADGLGGVALAANAPGGRDVLARGSGRIAMVDHVFSSANAYGPGELHQSGGTFYAMVSAGRRQVIAGPGSVGALSVGEPRRAYDSRVPTPAPGRLAPGQSRVISVADGRSVDTGVVTVPDVVPADATAALLNVTAVDAIGRGFLAVTPGPSTGVNASTLNWTTDGSVVANFTVVALVGGRDIRIHCGGAATTDFVVDVLGYHR